MSADLPLQYDFSEDEERMRGILDETEYDTELGVALAKDAQKLIAGELSEAEFAARHHEAIIEEFETDERPLEALADGDLEEVDDDTDRKGLKDALSGFDPDDEQSRREVLKKSGAVAGVLSLGAWGTAESMAGGDDEEESGVAAADEDEEGRQMGMVIDLERCDGCIGCVDACREENNWSSGANWMYVLAYEDEGRDDEDFLIRPCQHCTNAPCDKVCPVNARHTREEDGLVLTDYDICIGCRYCQVACPYGVNYFQWGDPGEGMEAMSDEHRYDDRGRHVDGVPLKGTMGKCTFCPTRQDDPETRGSVACMEACDAMGMGAIHFGDLNDPESRPNQYLEERRAEVRTNGPHTDEDGVSPHSSTEEDDISTFKLLEDKGTDPNVIYIGNEPGPNAQQVDGPVSYEGRVGADRRKDVLDEGADAEANGNHESTTGVTRGDGHEH
ncbi:MAG: 4Fe-4S dicluster domain-containing protein [Euryarchaeota archaeon]|nr:4Fe-4S dicluster domain-containing protein [Euryarchaeota archaeon]